MSEKYLASTGDMARLCFDSAEKSGLIAEALSEGVYPHLLWVVEALCDNPSTAFGTTALLLRGLSPHFNESFAQNISKAQAAGQQVVISPNTKLPALAPKKGMKNNPDTAAAMAWLRQQGLAVSLTGTNAKSTAPIFMKNDPDSRELRQQFAGHVWPAASVSVS